MKVFGINLKIPDLKFADPREAKFVKIMSLIIALAVLIGIGPSLYQVVEVSTKMAQMKSKSRTAQEKIKSLPQLRLNQKKYINQIAVLEKQFFDVDQIAELIGTISEMAKESAVTILSSKQYEYKGTDVAAKNPFYRPVLLRLELEGGYHDFGKFVSELERNPKLILVSEMNLEREEEKKDKLSIDLSILTFLKIGEGVSR